MKVFILGVAALAFLFLCREGSARLLEPDCGTTRTSNRVKRVVGGHDAEMFANPWMVLLLKDLNFTCGGTLITSRFVLTAANCIHLQINKVRLGEYDRSTNPDCSSMVCKGSSFEIDIERLIPHPSYAKPWSVPNDIGLVQMAQNVIFSDHIRPICLLVDQFVVRTFTSFDVTGWGKTNTSETSLKLQTATLTHFNRSKCQSMFEKPINEYQICAGSDTSDTCKGDAGGPLSAQLVYGEIQRVFQFGITSFGLTSCLGVGIYTNVTHYINWIENSIKENLYPFVTY
ncbi:spaetzle-processing enzyme-like [Drosophila rhopaloa]|uniref:Peptidase S1 domain-containing protein n=1 Tax=Drosophila rhopaloa TaxID=1041015 RepID=A0ABM5JFI9_DRORH|nr:spaetzle-processing enzyme-like [Drosophila rhopaloa]